MARYRKIDQTNLMMQVDLTNQLLPGSFEHALDYIIENRIDTSCFDDQFHNDETGATAYDPKALLKVILFAYSKGILSSRKIERACNENITFMALSGDLHPDHSTLAAFVSRECRPIREIFSQVLFLCAQMDLIGMEYLAVDGCKISSNAAKEHSGTHKELKKKKQKLQAKIKRLMYQHSRNDSNGDGDAERSIDKLNQNIQRIEDFLETHSPRIGTGRSGAEVKSNITDNESAKLKSSAGFIQGYNGMAVVDGKHQVVLETVAVGQNNEAELLPGLLDDLPDVLKSASLDPKRLEKTTLLADTAYHTVDNLKELTTKGIDAVIPDSKFRSRDEDFSARQEERRGIDGKIRPEDFAHDREANEYICPEGKRLVFHAEHKQYNRQRLIYRSHPGSCEGCPRAHDCFRAMPKDRRQLSITSKVEGSMLMKEMRDRVDSPEGRHAYSKRMGIIEPVFANIKHCKGMNYFTLRGEEKVSIQWMLYALVHNIEKLFSTGSVARMA